MTTLKDLERPTTATGRRHVYERKDRRRRKPFMAYIFAEKKYLGSFTTKREAERAVLDYRNGNLAT